VSAAAQGVAIQCQDVNSLIRDPNVPVGKVKFYMPPEVFARQAYSPAKVDVWTAGIILFVMLTKASLLTHNRGQPLARCRTAVALAHSLSSLLAALCVNAEAHIATPAAELSDATL
jgi:hypothetical protein